MKRRQFIKTTTAVSLASYLLPYQLFSQNKKLPYIELIGKGDPKLFGNGYLLRKEAYDAFIAMQNDAKKNGTPIYVVSSYRDYDHQKRIWERKFKQYTNSGMSPLASMNKIIEYSTIPGTSRHHWGTDIDIVDGRYIDTPNILSASHFEPDKPFYELGVWLQENAKSYGFHLVYTNEPIEKVLNMNLGILAINRYHLITSSSTEI